MRSNPITTCCKYLAVLALAGSAQAYPEFQKFVTQTSGRTVNCALCHMHSDGPEGTAPGQLGHLSAAEQTELGRARAAFEPNANVKSPILNAFGNHIIHSIGKKRFLELRLAPAELATQLPKNSDLDGDGITDVDEYLTGTHPLIKSDGHPWRLFKVSLLAHLGQIVLMLAATVLGQWGLCHLLYGFDIATRAKDDNDETET